MPVTDTNRTKRFEALATPCMTAAYSLALWMTRNGADAEDVVQDTFLRALRFFDGYRGGDFRAWLLQIVRNTARTWLVSNRPAGHGAAAADEENLSPAVDGPWVVDHERQCDPAEAAVAMADAAQLRLAIGALPVDYREVLILREFEGLSYREIAEVIGAPIGTVMSRLSRARDQLEASFQRQEGAHREPR